MTRRSAQAARLPKMAAAAVALIAAIMLVAGCSSSSSSSAPNASSASTSASSGPASGSDAGTTSSGVPAAVTSLLDSGYKGTFQAPPASGPKAAVGKSVWVISCGQVAASCAEIADAAMSAGKALGWNMTLFDGKLDPTLYSQGILQAIAAHVSGIFTVAVDCSIATSPLKQAKAAGIATVGVSNFDCNDPLNNIGPALYSTYVKYTGITGYGTTYADWKKYNAAWIIAQTDGKAKVINSYSPGYLVAEYQNKGFMQEMSLCSTCSIVSSLGITATEQAGTGAQEALQTAITQDQSANAIQVGVSGWFGRFANAAIRSSGRANLAIAGDECDAAAIAAIKAGGPQQMCVARDFGWESWAAMDELNRQFASPGSAPVDEGLGFEIVDKTHNLPSGSTWTAPFNYQSAYEKIWQG
jgi:ribose transport system substrate-binding protein